MLESASVLGKLESLCLAGHLSRLDPPPSSSLYQTEPEDIQSCQGILCDPGSGTLRNRFKAEFAVHNAGRVGHITQCYAVALKAEKNTFVILGGFPARI